jgi:uncharacterized membrane protein YfcA
MYSGMKKQTTPWVIWLLSLEALLFGGASVVHAGVLYGVPEHTPTATAEGFIAAVLILGALVSLLRFWRPRSVALTAQTVALIGTLIGVSIGLGLQTPPDSFFHAILLIVMALGLMTTFKWRPYSRFRYPPLTYGRVMTSRK